jgi:potassium efflux system protein
MNPGSWLWLVALALLPAPQAAEFSPATVPLAPTNYVVTAEAVFSRLTALSNRTDDLPLAARTNALALYLEARQRLLETERLLEETLRLRQETTETPATLADLQQQLDSPPAPPSLTLPTDAPVTEFEQQLARVEAGLAQATKEQEALAQEPQRRTARASELTQLTADARAARERLQQELRTAVPAELDPEIRQALRDRLQSRLQYREAELVRYEQELATLTATADLVRVRTDLAHRRVTALSQERDQWVTALNRRREQETIEATARAEQARRRTSLLNEPLLSRLAATNAVLARERTTLAGRLRDALHLLDTTQTNLAAQRASFQGLQARVDAAEAAGLRRNYAIGLLLRRQQAALERQGDGARLAEQQQSLLSTAQILQLTLVDARRALDPLDPHLTQLLATLPAVPDPARQEALAGEARTLLTEQRDLLTRLVRDYDTYLSLLLRVQAALREAAAFRKEFSTFLNLRVLWIRSAETLDLPAVRREAAAIAALITSTEWRQSLDLLGHSLRQSVLSNVALALGIALLVALRPHLRHRLAETAARARQGRNTSIAPTVEAGWATLLLALPLPLLFALLGWRTITAASLHQAVILQPLGQALGLLAGTLFVWEFLRLVCRPVDGLAVAHFRLPEEDARLLRQGLTWCLSLVPLLSGANRFLEAEALEGVSNRLTFIPVTLVFVAFIHLVLRPTGGLGSSLLGGNPERSGWRLGRRLAHPLAMAIPLVFAAMSIGGYHYSARHLWVRFLESVFVALGLKLVSAFFFRWFYLQRRRLAMAHAERLRGSETAEGQAGTTTLPLPEDDTQADLLTYLAQARRVLRWAVGLTLLVCLWGIWSSSLPALSALDQIPLWHLAPSPAAARPPSLLRLNPLPAADSDGSAATGEAAADPLGAPTPFVSLWDLMMVLLAAAVTIMAARNLPGFLEMAVFSRLHFERGSGYALTATLRYAIVLIGVIVVAQGLGLSWSKVQWLAAAITVGIGFGLQEVFANFVSGLILLFERPVRVGDIVTVADVSGVVTRIQIRATTIRDWDNRELILPNKELITGRFVNWTLSDSITRILCTVGVAYHSDVRQVRELLLKVARQHPAVLAEPAPFVAFESFGDSTLNFTLRAHVSRTDQRMTTLSDLNTSLLDEFRQAGIEIAFPQRDLHVRSLPPDFPPPAPPASSPR